MTFDRQVTGQRTFDYSKEGVAHYGLYADWFADLRAARRRRRCATTCGTEPRRTWRCGSAHRACGPGCTPLAGCGSARRGRRVLRRRRPAGQRATARGAGACGAAGTTCAVFGRDGRVAFVGSTARGRSAGGVRVGARASGRGTRVRGRTAYVVRGGRVIAVGRGSNVRARDEARGAPRARRGRGSCRVRRPRGSPGVRWRRQARSRRTRR